MSSRNKFLELKPIEWPALPSSIKKPFIYGSNSHKPDYIQYVEALIEQLNKSTLSREEIHNYINNEIMPIFKKEYSHAVPKIQQLFINNLNIYKQSKATPTNSFYATNWQQLKNNPYAGAKYKKTKKNCKNKKSRRSNRNGQRKNAMGSPN